MGTGYEAAVSRIGNIDLDLLKSQGVTKEMAAAWRDFYQEVFRLQPSNGSAHGRVELMQHILSLFEQAERES